MTKQQLTSEREHTTGWDLKELTLKKKKKKATDQKMKTETYPF